MKISGSYYQVITINWVVPFFGIQCSFVDDIKLNYSLADTALQYVRVAVSGCVQSQMSVSELHTLIQSVRAFSVTTPGSGRREENEPPGSATALKG